MMRKWVTGLGIVALVGFAMAVYVGVFGWAEWTAFSTELWIRLLVFTLFALGLLGLIAIWVAHLVLSPGSGRVARGSAVAFGILLLTAVAFVDYVAIRYQFYEDWYSSKQTLGIVGLGMSIVGFWGLLGVAAGREQSIVRKWAIGFGITILVGLLGAAFGVSAYVLGSGMDFCLSCIILAGLSLVPLVTGVLGLIAVWLASRARFRRLGHATDEG